MLERLAARPVRYFRPPFGAQSISTYLVTRACGLEVVVWGPDAHDWDDRPPAATAAHALDLLHGGDVLLLHDGLERPEGEPMPQFDRLTAFELILDGIASRGLEPMTVGDLVTTGRTRRTAWFRP